MKGLNPKGGIMLIKWKFRNNYYSLSIGYNTPWFEQISFITIVKEYYDSNNKVEFASMIWNS